MSDKTLDRTFLINGTKTIHITKLERHLTNLVKIHNWELEGHINEYLNDETFRSDYKVFCKDNNLQYDDWECSLLNIEAALQIVQVKYKKYIPEDILDIIDSIKQSNERALQNDGIDRSHLEISQDLLDFIETWEWIQFASELVLSTIQEKKIAKFHKSLWNYLLRDGKSCTQLAFLEMYQNMDIKDWKKLNPSTSKIVINAWWWQLVLRKIEEIWICKTNADLLIQILDSEDKKVIEELVKLYEELFIAEWIKIKSIVSNKLIDMWYWSIEMKKIERLWIDGVWKSLLIYILKSQDQNSIEKLLKLYKNLNKDNWKEIHISVSEKIFDMWHWSLVVKKLIEFWKFKNRFKLISHILDSNDYESVKVLIKFYKSKWFKRFYFSHQEKEKFEEKIELLDKYW